MENNDIGKLDGCIRTYTGIKLNLFNPHPGMIHRLDIIKGLSYKPHFGGQSPAFFSIAAHSLLVRDLANEENERSVNMVRAALLHDAAEAYIGDMIKPLKVHLPLFVDVERGLMAVIFGHFEVDPEWLLFLKKYDIAAQREEMADFWRDDKRLVYQMPDVMEKVFEKAMAEAGI